MDRGAWWATVHGITKSWARLKRLGFSLRVGMIPWRRKWQRTSVFSPGESHGQRSLVGYSPRGRKELDTTEATEHTHPGQIYMVRHF